ncbi:MAG: hypothetical protein PHW52_04040 [Candidatus Pacebacteria bacterium]|nr:hypothetical protein [Candidatus Paceibacterota bacterium]
MSKYIIRLLIVCLLFVLQIDSSYAANGECGPAADKGHYSTPTSGFCNAGIFNNLVGTGHPLWRWNCLGTSGGTSKQCSAWGITLQNGTCGSSNGKVLISAPTDNLCSTGTVNFRGLDGSKWYWSCNGSNGGTNAECSATKSASALDGRCGTASSKYFSSKPTADFCAAGTPSAVSGVGPWLWSCKGTNGGSTVSCKTLSSSGNGFHWSTIPNTGNSSWKSVTYGNGLFVAVASYSPNNDKLIMTSPDGVSWTGRTAPEAGWNGVAYGNNMFVAVPYSTKNTNNTIADFLITSPDGMNWTQRIIPKAANWRSIAYGNGLFVAVGDGDKALVSSNGVSWSTKSLPANNTWTSVAYGNGLFVAIAYNSNQLATSKDGTTWTLRSLPVNNSWWSVTYGNNMFVAVGSMNKNEVYSSDGINWKSSSFTESNDWRSVVYGEGIFVAVNRLTKNIMYSSDGTYWKNDDIPQSSGWMSIAYGNGVFVAVAYTGTDRVMVSKGNLVIEGKCGAANGQVFSETPTENLCASGTVSFRGLDGSKWYWSCNGSNGGTNAECSASKKIVTVNGKCGYANGQSFSTTPNQYLCTSGTVNFRGLDGSKWYWSCNGSNGGTNAECSANKVSKTVNGECGISNGQSFETAPTTNLCSKGVINFRGLDGSKWYWSCQGVNGGTNAECYADVKSAREKCTWTCNKWSSCSRGIKTRTCLGLPENCIGENPYPLTEECIEEEWDEGVCGASNEQDLPMKPSKDLCASGTPSEVSGTGLWAWICKGSNGGKDSSCSTCSSSWKNVLTPNESVNWGPVAYGNGIFLSTIDGKVMTSSDGVNWKLSPIALPSPSSLWWNPPVFGDGKFLLVQPKGGVALTSSDGINWTSRQFPTPSNIWATWKPLTYIDGKFLTMTNGYGDPEVAFSSDGVNWTKHEISTRMGFVEEFRSVSLAYGNGVFVAVAHNNSKVMVSSDAVNWKRVEVPETNFWNAVAFGNGVFVAIAHKGEGKILTSPDGENWTVRSGFSNDTVNNITFANGMFVFGGMTIKTSVDGIEWKESLNGVPQAWHGRSYTISYGPGLFFATTAGSSAGGSDYPKLMILKPCKKVSGECGSANGESFETVPTKNLCAKGVINFRGLDGSKWYWSCGGVNGGTNAECSAEKSSASSCKWSCDAWSLCVNGMQTRTCSPSPKDCKEKNPYSLSKECSSEEALACGSANGKSFKEKPTTNLCTNGNLLVMVGSTGPWIWVCQDKSKGKSVICSAKKSATPVNGVCGEAHGKSLPSKPFKNLCVKGVASIVYDGEGIWLWLCRGIDGGSMAVCNAKKSISLIDGKCGSANGKTFADTPNTNLCSTGTVNFRGLDGSTWYWSCNGLSGGSNDECSANKSTSPLNGTCGSANGKTFADTPNTNLCSNGTLDFRGLDGSAWYWSCNGLKGGTNAECKAGKSTGIVACGPANGVASASAPTSSLCVDGSKPLVAASSDGGWVWNCKADACSAPDPNKSYKDVFGATEMSAYTGNPSDPDTATLVIENFHCNWLPSASVYKNYKKVACRYLPAGSHGGCPYCSMVEMRIEKK